MSFPPADIVPLVEEIAATLRARQQTVAISEAACGGLLSAYLVSVPGALHFFVGSTLVYSLKLRLKLSGWLPQDILEYTGPSEAVVARLARNLRMELGATYVLLESGFAGPSSTTSDEVPAPAVVPTVPEEAVGTAFLAVASASGETSREVHAGGASRTDNMQAFARHGLELLLEVVKRG